jgi:hypothetical protein
MRQILVARIARADVTRIDLAGIRSSAIQAASGVDRR